MRDLFISMGEKISVRNFTDGSLTYREIPTAEIASLIQKTRDSGAKVMAYFEFGSMPSKKKSREFQELLAAFEKITGAHLSQDDFKAKVNTETGDVLPNFNFIPTVTEDMNMLAVGYYFERNEGADSFEDWFSVCDTSMNFHFFERSP
jgi:hypothetical protein